MQWLLVGALGAETLPLVAALQATRPLGRRLVLGRLGGAEVGVLTCGVGPRKAESRTRDQLQRLKPTLGVVSLGTCGALVDRLEIGAVVGVRSVRDESGEPVEIDVLPGLTPARLITVREAVWTSERRHALAARGEEICEMEAHAVMAAATDAGLPFHAVKVVSDHAGRDKGDKAVGKPRERNPLVIGRFLARAGRLSQHQLLPALREALPTG